jgi:hypothetical protein
VLLLLLLCCCCCCCQEEEASLLPQLAAVLNAETQLQLGIQFEAAKVREHNIWPCYLLQCAAKQLVCFYVVGYTHLHKGA